MARGSTAILVAVTGSHFVSDAYTAILTPLLPELRAEFGVSIAATATLVAMLSFVGSVLQPAFGVLADHSDRRLLAAFGPALAGLGMTLLGVAPSFLLVAALVTLGGIGSGLFHPAAVAYVHQGASARRRGLFASLFSAGGTAGQAMGPLVVTALGSARLHWALPVGIASGLLSWIVTPSTRAATRTRPKWRDYASVFHGPIRTLWAASVLRSLCTISYISLLGFALTARGFAGHIGPSLATYSLAAALGGIVGGLFSDRLGRIMVLRSSILSSIPLFVLLVYTTPAAWWYYPLTALVGAMVNANTPVAIVTAQEYAPRHVATASALMMGFAWGTSGVLFTVVGALADMTSPRTAMVAAILLLLPALWLTVRLPEPGEARV
ncbi:MAG TPA: MFS transporter [Gemmatimonadaceae bacterium]|nr:MFS transporter [Gemmatimonadaceae bacterium]